MVEEAELMFNFKKILGWAVVIFIFWYVFTSPTAAAGTWHSITSMLTSAASSLSTFLTSAGG